MVTSCPSSLSRAPSRGKATAPADVSMLVARHPVTSTTWARRSVPAPLVQTRTRQGSKASTLVPEPRPCTPWTPSCTCHLFRPIKQLAAPSSSVTFRPAQPTVFVAMSFTEHDTSSLARCHRRSTQSRSCTRRSRAVHHAAMHRRSIHLKTTPSHRQH
jgi:hypothetical protein